MCRWASADGMPFVGALGRGDADGFGLVLVVASLAGVGVFWLVLVVAWLASGVASWTTIWYGSPTTISGFPRYSTIRPVTHTVFPGNSTSGGSLNAALLAPGILTVNV